MRFSRSSRARRLDNSLTFMGGTSPVLFKPVYRWTGLGYLRGEIRLPEAILTRLEAAVGSQACPADARKPGYSRPTRSPWGTLPEPLWEAQRPLW